eukprot:6090185-Amphidinium_carterae.2
MLYLSRTSCNVSFTGCDGRLPKSSFRKGTEAHALHASHTHADAIHSGEHSLKLAACSGHT